MTRNCTPCSQEHNQYQDDWLCTFIEWLDEVTCIGWVQAYPDTAKPGEDELTDTQYGVVDGQNIKYILPNKNEKGQTNIERTCTKFHHRIEHTVELTVFNHADMPERNGQCVRTSGDVLVRVLDAYYAIDELGHMLTEQGVAINDYGTITDIKKIVRSSYQRRSTLTLTLCVSRTSSFTEDNVKDIKLNIDCSDKSCEVI